MTSFPIWDLPLVSRLVGLLPSLLPLPVVCSLSHPWCHKGEGIPYESVVVIVELVKDCGYIKMSELSDVDLAGEGLPRNLTSEQKKVILCRMLHGFDVTNTYDNSSGESDGGKWHISRTVISV